MSFSKQPLLMAFGTTGTNHRGNLRPRAWGWATWTALFAQASGLGLRPSSRVSRPLASTFVRSVENLRELLPCAACREHFARLLKSDPPPPASGQSTRDEYERWVARAYRTVHRHSSQRGRPVRLPAQCSSRARRAFFFAHLHGGGNGNGGDKAEIPLPVVTCVLGALVAVLVCLLVGVGVVSRRRSLQRRQRQRASPS